MASPSAPPAAGPTGPGEVQQRCAELFAARGERLQRFAQRLLGADAPDGVQEVFAAACRSLPSFRGEARLTTWFHRLALRVLCAFRRRRDARAAREQPDAEAEARLSPRALAAYQQSPFDLCAREERRQRVLQALDRLSPPLREVLLLRGEGLSYGEIAEALAIPLGTVKSRMAAATVLLAEKLQRLAEDER